MVLPVAIAPVVCVELGTDSSVQEFAAQVTVLKVDVSAAQVAVPEPV